MSSESTYTIHEAVNKMGFGKFQIRLLFIIGFYSLCESMEMALLSILTPVLRCSWGITYWEGSGLSMAIFLGMMIGSVFWGYLSDNYGRKKSIIYSAGILFYYAVLSTFSPNYYWILIFRGLSGFAIGAVAQAVTLYSEFLPTNKRVISIALLAASWALGSCCEFVLALFIMPLYGWRWLLGLSSLPIIIFLITSIWLPESIRFDATIGNVDGVLKILKQMAKDNNKTILPGSLVVDDLKAIKRGRLVDLFIPELRVTTLLLFVIWSVVSFCYFGNVIMTPGLLQMSDRCNAHQISSEESCQSNCKNLQTKDYISLLWISVAEFPGIAVAIVLTEFIGRRRTMQINLICFSIIMFLLSICSLSRTWLVILLCGARGIIDGVIQTEYLYASEVYPTTLRAAGIGACASMAKVGAMISSIIAHVLFQESIPITLRIYGSLGILASLASFFLPIETKGRELKDSHLTL